MCRRASRGLRARRAAVAREATEQDCAAAAASAAATAMVAMVAMVVMVVIGAERMAVAVSAVVERGQVLPVAAAREQGPPRADRTRRARNRERR